ncbi:MAG TPA: hypothetical protein V6C76_02235 [Drouetiella sp.]
MQSATDLSTNRSDTGSQSAASHRDAGNILRLQKNAPKFPVAALLYLSAWFVVLWAGIALPSLEDISCFGVLAVKHRILDAAPSPKIIIASGSNSFFGIDGSMMEQAFHRKVVNMGLCVIFPLSYLLEEIKDSIKPGDVVVMPLEFSFYSTEYLRPLIMSDILDGYGSAAQWIVRTDCCTWDDRLKILLHLRANGVRKLDYALKHLRQIVQHRCKWSLGKPNPGLDVINSKNLDASGGLTWHLNRPWNRDGVERKIGMQVPKGLDEYTINELNNFNAFCKQRGATVYLMPPSAYDAMYQRDKTPIDKIIAQCKQRVTIPFLSNPGRYAFPDTMIFGGHFHLTGEGRKLRTQMMIEDLHGPLSAKP